HRETQKGASSRSLPGEQSIIPSNSGRQSLAGRIDSSLPIVENDTALESSFNSDEESHVTG
ncbi:hypothetical protein ACQP3D_25455, partial [Escherichia coli]